MRVCGVGEPVDTVRGASHRVACWLHGPEDAIPPGGDRPLEREELASADEA
jgi:hypothetical protein